jgi:hypothetical protein
MKRGPNFKDFPTFRVKSEEKYVKPFCRRLGKNYLCLRGVTIKLGCYDYHTYKHVNIRRKPIVARSLGDSVPCFFSYQDQDLDRSSF